MGYVVIVFIIIIIVAFTKGTQGNQTDVSGDPCIDQIVQYVRAVNEAKTIDFCPSWIDFYNSDKLIVCRFFDFDGSSELRLINDYSNNSYPNSEAMIEGFKKIFNERVFSSFPQGTQLEIRDSKEGSYEILYSVTPRYQNAFRNYRSAVANAIRQEGLAFADKDEKGTLNPSRIYIKIRN